MYRSYVTRTEQTGFNKYGVERISEPGEHRRRVWMYVNHFQALMRLHWQRALTLSRVPLRGLIAPTDSFALYLYFGASQRGPERSNQKALLTQMYIFSSCCLHFILLFDKIYSRTNHSLSISYYSVPSPSLLRLGPETPKTPFIFLACDNQCRFKVIYIPYFIC